MTNQHAKINYLYGEIERLEKENSDLRERLCTECSARAVIIHNSGCSQAPPTPGTKKLQDWAEEHCKPTRYGEPRIRIPANHPETGEPIAWVDVDYKGPRWFYNGRPYIRVMQKNKSEIREELMREYAQWLKKNGLPEMSADELLCEIETQNETTIERLGTASEKDLEWIAWLIDFCERWDRNERGE